MTRNTPPSRLQAAEGLFGCALRELREDRGVKTFDLAAASDMSGSYVSRLERGERQPSRAAIDRLAHAMELSTGERDRLLYTAGYAPSIHYMRYLVGEELVAMFRT